MKRNLNMRKYGLTLPKFALYVRPRLYSTELAEAIPIVYTRRTNLFAVNRALWATNCPCQNLINYRNAIYFLQFTERDIGRHSLLNTTKVFFFYFRFVWVCVWPLMYVVFLNGNHSLPKGATPVSHRGSKLPLSHLSQNSCFCYWSILKCHHGCL